ncbi:MAG TPA: glycosyltransferase family 9 protein [Chloroflexia bacterium]|nr:glycosyltransferase family 9 protein [Chloroflexia bacterium]
MINPKTPARTALIRLLYGAQASGFRRESLRRRARDEEDPIKRILVVRPDHLGDLLFATAALDRIRKAFPGAHITGLVGPWGKAMWQGNPSLNALQVLPFPGISAARTRALSPYLMINKSAWKLFQRRYDLGIVLRFDHWWGAALLWAAGIPQRWGYSTPGMDTWLTGSVPYSPGRHEVEQNLTLVEAMLGSVAGPSRLQRIGTPEVDRGQGVPSLRPPRGEPLQPELARAWLLSPRHAVIHPGTAAANKLWTIDGWAEVARRLTSEGWSVALTGSPEEQKLAGAIEAQVGSGAPLVNLAGKTANLGQLVWVLGQADLVLGVDSGPLHIADALGKRTLHLYGPSDEQIWGPWGDLHRHRALRAPGTAPTMHLDVGSTALEGGPEMKAITPDMVMSEVKSLLADVRSSAVGST